MILVLLFLLARLAIAITPILDVYHFDYFRTEPDFHPPKLTILKFPKNASLLQPDHIFIDPTAGFSVPNKHGNGTNMVAHGLGPLIYDMFGNLVWSGENLHGHYRTQNTHPCNLYGEESGGLCWTKSMAPTVYHIFDKHYEKVLRSQESSKGEDLNQHEFTTANNGTSFIQCIYRKIQVDFTEIGGQNSSGIKDGCFEEIDLKTKRLLFRFCSDGLFPLGLAAHSDNPGIPKWDEDHVWDYQHINSVDKNEEGDYIVSSRYYHQVFKVAGKDAKKIHGIEPGTIIWRLGGDMSNFTIKNYDLPFRLQHDARFISTGRSETVISIHNNKGEIGTDGVESSNICSGKIIKINNETMTGEIVQKFVYPEKNPCYQMGSMRLLPNGNAFMGFGGTPYFAEFSPNGSLLFYATFKVKGEDYSRNYRSVKAPWVGLPKTTPRLVAYSNGCREKPLIAYVSWNGATEVKSWRFQYRTKTSTWIPVGTFNKTGFETKVTLDKGSKAVPRLVHVEALAANGTVIGEVTNSTFIPTNKAIRRHECGLEGCSKPMWFNFAQKFNGSSSCDGIELITFVGLAFAIFCVEFIVSFYDKTLDTIMGTGDPPLKAIFLPLDSGEPEKTMEAAEPEKTGQ